ncbi:MAG: hypothetical protein KDK99_06910 [Verrucomicrobiales bacterium]|nr:hypothetical protein [Verrucomicrobiales bacterium]
MALLYQREVRRQGLSRRRGWLLTLLRSGAVFLAVLTLAAPVIQHRTTVRQLGRVILAIDASESMRLTDEEPGTEDLSRWDRLQRLLLEGSPSLLAQLAEHHDVELTALHGGEARRIWWRRQGGKDASGPLPGSFPLAADATTTDLDQTLGLAVQPVERGTAVVLFTDGRHNADGSPEDQAAVFAKAGVPLFTIGLGAETPPPDLSIADLDVPESVFAGEHVRGSVTVRDSMSADLPASLRIESQGKVMWEKTFQTTGHGTQRFEFDFPAIDLPPAADPTQETLRDLSATVAISGSAASAEKTRANNRSEVAFQLLDRKRKVLVLDGRPRWDTRYIHNHFDRDERWSATVEFSDLTSPPGAGSIARAFPKSRDDLFTYDLVILGDLAVNELRPEQVEWLVEFVEKRGGGLIWIDGARGHLRGWPNLAPSLLPVTWPAGNTAPPAVWHWSTDTPTATPAALLLAGSRTANAELWQALPAPRWAAHIQPAPGAQVYATLQPPAGEAWPALVFQTVGAGAVLYLATDELWRWRYQVGDLYHKRLWGQLAAWISAPPFQSENDTLAIGSDQLRYHTDETAEIRVRLRNAAGNIITQAEPKAWLMQNGTTLAMIDLTTDATHAGTYRGLTPKLKPGDYEIAVSPAPSAPRSDLRLHLRATEGANRELTQLTLDSLLLRQLSQTTGAQFLREQQAATELPSLLHEVDRRQTSVRETLLWSSWWWLGTLLFLLTLEWLLRKRFRLL